jgi:hypothetical protein
MPSHAKEELGMLIPLLLGAIFIGAIIYYIEFQMNPKVYSTLLIGFGLSTILSLWFGKKTLYFVLGIALSTPVWTIATTWSDIFS